MFGRDDGKIYMNLIHLLKISNKDLFEKVPFIHTSGAWWTQLFPSRTES